jgi:phosphoesterase RecJ-like protein
MKDLAERILSAKRILMSTHKDPDGDGIGAILALCSALGPTGRKIDVLLPDPCPKRLRFLDPDGWLHALAADAENLGVTKPDLALILDTHQWVLLGRVGELIQRAKIPTLFLDHHPVRNGKRDDVYGDQTASSTGELVHRLLVGDLDLPIDKRIAECIYTSIAFDTHCFRFVRNSPSPHLVAADLISRGIDANRIYRHLFASNPVGKMRLMGRLMSVVQIEEEGVLAWVGLPLEWIHEHGVCEDDMRDVVNCLLEIDRVEVAVLLKEVKPGTVKVSLRSKGKLEIHEAARRLGGGGHAYAAGATLKSDLDASRKKVLSEVVNVVRNAKPHS